MSNDIADAEFGAVPTDEQPTPTAESQQSNLEMIFDVPIRISAELGDSVIKVKDLLNICPGSVVELDRQAGESIDLKVNGVLIGKGDVVEVLEQLDDVKEIDGEKEDQGR